MPGFGLGVFLLHVEAALAEVSRLDVAYVQKSVAAHAEVDERRLDTGFKVDHHSLVDVSYIAVLAGSFDIQLLQHTVFNDGNPAFFRLRDVDEHFLFHLAAFLLGKTAAYDFVLHHAS